MKKLAKLSLLVPVPLVLGLILNLAGNRLGNAQLAAVGSKIMAYGTPAVMFILVVVGLIMIISGRWSLSDGAAPAESEKTEETSGTDEEKARMEEQEAIENINNSYGYDSQFKQGQYIADNSAKIYRNSGNGDRIKGWIFFGFLMTDFALILVFSFLGIFLGAVICFALFGGTILLSLIIKVILEKTSRSKRFNRDRYEKKTGTVKLCAMSSMSSVGGSRNSSVRVTGITYRVVLDVEGREYNAYSDNVYAEGQTVFVWVRKKGGGLARIEE